MRVDGDDAVAFSIKNRDLRRAGALVAIASLIAGTFLLVSIVYGLVVSWFELSVSGSDLDAKPVFLLELGEWAQALLLLIAGVIAYRQWRDQTRTAQVSQTFDFISRAQRDEEIIGALSVKRKITVVAKEERTPAREYFLSVFKGEARPQDHPIWREGRPEHVVGGGPSPKSMEPRAGDASEAEEGGALEIVADDDGASITHIYYTNSMSMASRLSPREAIDVILNHYEVMALGMYKGALDEDMLKGWWLTTYVQDYEDLKDVIREIQHQANNTRIFRNFGDLAQRWSQSAPWTGSGSTG